MYRIYELTDSENGKIVRLRSDGDVHFYNVFESQEECDAEQKRLDQIDAEYEQEKAAYLQSTQCGE